MKRNGMKKGFNFKEAKKNDRALTRDLKISKTFRVDSDVFMWLQEESERTGIPYQTLMNAKLRESMSLPDRVTKLVNDALAKRQVG